MALIGSLVAQLSLDSATFARDLAKAGDSIDKTGRRMASVGRNISTYVSAPLIGFGALALKTAGDFEEGMNRVAAVSGATETELKELREEAKRLGASIEFGKFSARDAAEGMGFLAQAGFETTEIIGAMPATLQLASAAQIELAESADIVTNILTGYGKNVEDLSNINDVLVKTFTSSNVNIKQLGNSMKFVGPIAQSAGVQFEEAAAAIGLMGNAGVQGEMAGTALRGAISRMLDPTAKVTKAMAELGLNFTDSADRLLPLSDIIEQLEPHAENAGAFMALFGQRAGPAMAALVGQGSAALSEFTAELENSAGTAADVASTQMQGFAAAMEGMRSSFEALQIAVAESGLLDFVTELIKSLANFLQSMSQVDPKILKFVTVIGAAVAAGGPLLLFLGAAAIAIGALVTPIGLVAAAITGAAGIIVALVAFRKEIVESLIGAVEHVVRVFTDFKTQALDAVIALVEGIQEWLGSRLSAAFDAVAAPIAKTVDLFRGMYEAVVGGSYVPDMVDEIGDHFRRLDGQMVRPAESAVMRTNAAFAKLATEPFKNAIRGIQDSFTNMFEDIFSGGVNSFKDLAASVKRIFIRLAAEIATLMVIRPALSSVLSGSGLGGVAQQMGVAGGGGIGPLGVTLASGFSTVTNAINTLGTSFGFAAAAAGPAANPWGGPIGGFNFAKPGIFGGQTLAGFLGAGALGAGIGGLGASAFGLSKEGTIGSSVAGGLGAAVGSIVPGIGTIVGGIGGSIIGGIVGSLFKSKPSDKSQDAAINFVTNSIERWGQTGDKFSQQNRDLADQLAQQAIELSNAIQALTGGRATGDLGIKVGSRDGLRLSQGGQQIGNFGQDVERFQSAMVKAIADSIKGAGGIERQILSRADTSSAESLLADLQFGQVFRELTQRARPLTAELNAMKQQFADARVQARRLGLDVQLLKDAQRDAAQSFRKGLMTELRTLAGEISPISQAFNELRDRFKAVKKEANSIGLNRDEIIRLQRVALKDFRQGIMGELKALAGAATPAAQAFEALIEQFRAAKRAANEIGLNRNEIQNLQKQAANDFRKGFLASLSDATGISGVNDFTKQMAALTQQFAQARKEARAIGISVATINKIQVQAVESLQKSFMDELRGLAGVSGTFSDELETLVDRFALARKEAHALGLSIVEIRQLEAQAIQTFTQKALGSIESRMAQQASQIRAHFDSILTPLRNFRSSLDFGPLSANAPTEQFRLAQENFRSLAAEAANSNRAALEALPNAAQAFIQQAQSFGASGAQASAAAEVQRVFDSLIDAQEILQFEMTRDLPDAIDDAANRQVQALREGFDQLAAELRDVKREIQATNQRRVA